MTGAIFGYVAALIVAMVMRESHWSISASLFCAIAVFSTCFGAGFLAGI